MLKPLNSDILFVFIDELINGKFVETHDRFYIPQSEESTVKRPRWGKVIALGPKVDKEIILGSKILIENLMWTRGLDYQGIKIWKTDDSKVLGIEEE